jgi:hypothetical protein
MILSPYHEYQKKGRALYAPPIYYQPLASKSINQLFKCKAPSAKLRSEEVRKSGRSEWMRILSISHPLFCSSDVPIFTSMKRKAGRLTQDMVCPQASAPRQHPLQQ